MYKRKQKFEGSVSESFFLWGPRQTGKSTLLKVLYPDSLWFDLLLTDVFERFQRNPSQLREIIMATQPVKPVVIDEIQKIYRPCSTKVTGLLETTKSDLF